MAADSKRCSALRQNIPFYEILNTKPLANLSRHPFRMWLETLGSSGASLSVIEGFCQEKYHLHCVIPSPTHFLARIYVFCEARMENFAQATHISDGNIETVPVVGTQRTMTISFFEELRLCTIEIASDHITSGDTKLINPEKDDPAVIQGVYNLWFILAAHGILSLVIVLPSQHILHHYRTQVCSCTHPKGRNWDSCIRRNFEHSKNRGKSPYFFLSPLQPTLTYEASCAL